MYTEIYVLDSTIVFHAANGIIYLGQFYVVNKDTLLYKIVDENYSNTLVEKKVKLFRKTDSSMIWEFLNPHEQWEFFRLKEDINIFSIQSIVKAQLIKEDSNEQVELLKRSKKYNCLDIRSKNEILQDSIAKSQFKF